MSDQIKVVNTSNATLGKSILGVHKGNERAVALEIVLEIVKSHAAAGADFLSINRSIQALSDLVDVVEKEIAKTSKDAVKISPR